jgi:hypothetical protein
MGSAFANIHHKTKEIKMEINEENNVKIVSEQCEIILKEIGESIYGFKIMGPALMSAIIFYCSSYGMSLETIQDLLRQSCDAFKKQENTAEEPVANEN